MADTLSRRNSHAQVLTAILSSHHRPSIISTDNSRKRANDKSRRSSLFQLVNSEIQRGQRVWAWNAQFAWVPAFVVKSSQNPTDSKNTKEMLHPLRTDKKASKDFRNSKMIFTVRSDPCFAQYIGMDSLCQFIEWEVEDPAEHLVDMRSTTVEQFVIDDLQHLEDVHEAAVRFLFDCENENEIFLKDIFFFPPPKKF